MLRAIVSLGDLDLAAGEVAAARERYQAVLAVQATHPRAALGLADASLATGQDLAPALKTLEAVAADRESTVPARDRVRFDLVHARLLAANGRAAEALPILDEASARHPGPEVVATRAAVLAASGDLDGAVAAAKTAVDRSRGEARFRELVAQLQLRQGRYRALLATSAKEPTRTLLVYRGIARLSLGDVAGARTELEATRRDRKMTPEAAAWAALVEIAAGRTVAVAGVVDALLEQPIPHPAALLARGRLDVAAGRRPSAEQRLREAIERDPDLVEASTALSDLLVETGRAPEALELMKATLGRSPGRGVGRVALARALIAAGRPDDALGELTAVLGNAPEDPPAEAAARQLLRTIRRPGRKR
jgi:predicted Zn-dependent protease